MPTSCRLLVSFSYNKKKPLFCVIHGVTFLNRVKYCRQIQITFNDGGKIKLCLCSLVFDKKFAFTDFVKLKSNLSATVNKQVLAAKMSQRFQSPPAGPPPPQSPQQPRYQQPMPQSSQGPPMRPYPNAPTQNFTVIIRNFVLARSKTMQIDRIVDLRLCQMN